MILLRIISGARPQGTFFICGSRGTCWLLAAFFLVIESCFSFSFCRRLLSGSLKFPSTTSSPFLRKREQTKCPAETTIPKSRSSLCLVSNTLSLLDRGTFNLLVGRRQVRRVDKSICQKCRQTKSMYIIRNVTFCKYAFFLPYHIL